jgi:hypothetical protein
MADRNYSNTAVSTTLDGAINSAVTSLVVADATGYPAVPFAIRIDAGLATEEVILVGAKSSTTFSSLTRGYDGTSAAAHTSGAAVEHVLVAADLEETNAHLNATPATAADSDTATGIHHTVEKVAANYSAQAFADAKSAGTSNKAATADHKHEMPADPQTIVDAKGDLVAGSADNTWGRLAVGSNGQVLKADSAEALGVKWAAEATGGGAPKVYVSGRYIFSDAVTANGTTGDQSLDRTIAYAFPVWITSAVTIDEMGVHCGSAVAGATCKVAIYSSDGSNLPDSRLALSASLDLSTTGAKTAAVSQSLTAGTMYWLVVKGTGSANGSVKRSAPNFIILGGTSLDAPNIGVPQNTGLATGDDPPASFTVSGYGALQAIHIGMRVA